MEPENKSNSTLIIIIVVVILVLVGVYVWQNMDANAPIPVEESANELDTLEQELGNENLDINFGVDNLE